MEQATGSLEEMRAVLEFLAEKDGLPCAEFIEKNLRAIRQKKIEDLERGFYGLDDAERKLLLARLGAAQAAPQAAPSSLRPGAAYEQSEKYSLNQLENMSPQDLVKSRPRVIWINQAPAEVKNWKEASLAFVRALVKEGHLTKERLPFYPNPRSAKAFVSPFPAQPNGKSDGLFEKAADNFYVDIKHNAKYHVLNMLRSLRALGLLGKWEVELEFRDGLSLDGRHL